MIDLASRISPRLTAMLIDEGLAARRWKRVAAEVIGRSHRVAWRGAFDRERHKINALAPPIEGRPPGVDHV